MKKYIVSLLMLAVFTYNYSQEKSLLWEISGNGLNKNSYLYGTMHVSKKVAFRLDNVFFKALNASECVALESDPTKWLEHRHKDLELQFINTNGSFSDNYYSKILKFKPLEDRLVRGIIRFDNNLINGYLYRKNSFQDNFEEETYLDMFIYQAGKKNGKPIIGLEDIKESRFLTTKARYNVNKKKPDAWLSKLLKKEGRYSLLEDIYRDRNIELLDSIGSATNTEFYREHMLFKRNQNMVDVLDSIMRTKSVFAGVGAAHLGGNKGMLQMLRDKGYKLKALTSEQTDFAEQEKNKLEKLFKNPELSYQSTPDGFITIKSFDELREFNYNNLKNYIAPDMTNGAYLTVNRLNRFDFIPNKKEKVDLEEIDYLLYEDIPGDIIKKEELTEPFPGISILNKTNKGDYQKYHIYKTPLEIIVIKFGGKLDFVLKHEAEIFNSIKFKEKTSELTLFNDPFNKYEFKFPKYYITDNLEKSGKKLIQGTIDSDFYFFQEYPSHDLNYIEDDDFEAKYIHTNFYNELEIEDYKGKFTTTNYSSYESSAETDSLTHRKIWLKTVVKDGSYYSLGYSGFDAAKAGTYFKSLTINQPKYEHFKTVTDSSLLFTVKSTTKSPLSYRNNKNKRLKTFDKFRKTATYTSKSNERVVVTKTKYHDLQMFENIDSLWNDITYFQKNINKIGNKKALKIYDEKKQIENGANVYSYNYQDSLSHKKILVKYIQLKGALFKLETLVDNVSDTSTYVSTFYESFKPIDSLLGVDVFKDKTPTFFEALKTNDSIVLTGYSKIKFKEKDTNKIIGVLSSLDFPEDKEKIKLHLISQLIKLDKSPLTIDFIEGLYLSSYTEPKTQISILNALLHSKEKSSINLFLELIKNDIPLGGRQSKITFFNKNTKPLIIAKKLYPDLLHYSKEEYKTPIYGLLTTLLDSSIVKPKLYKSYRQDILSDAKTELKRSLIKNNSYTSKKYDLLDDYTKLLFPFRKDKYTSQFYDKLLLSKNVKGLTTLYVLLSKAKEPISNELKRETLYNEKAQATLVEKLEKQDLLDKNILEIIDLETFAKSKLLANSRIKKNDSITLYDKRTIETDKEESITVFIYKRVSKAHNNERAYLHFVAFKNKDSDFYDTKPYYISKKNGSRLNNIASEEEIIKKIIPVIKYKTRKRITGRFNNFSF